MKYCEFKRLTSDKDSFELESVSLAEEGPFDKFIETYWSKEKVKGRLMQTSMWTFKRETKSVTSLGQYKVKVYQMDDDEFRAKLYPVSYIDSIRYLWFNRNFFRIL